ncbi:restriction endonuclease subunit S [Vibrio atlanticus]|uniref:restriction endonuclease subunit S n=1 Tax=Vibrio atlanticus TaxID=693153 RepID=UPI0035539BFD
MKVENETLSTVHSQLSIEENVPKLRFGEFSGLWDQKSISEVATKVTDGTHDTPKPVESGIPYITAIHVKDGAINYDNCYYVEPEVHKVIYKRCNPEKGDLLLVNIGSGTATCAINTCDDEFSMKNVALIKPNREMLEPYFLEQIQRKSTARLFHRLTSGGAQPFFSLKEIKKLTHYYPSLPEQQKIASFLSKVDEKIGLLSEKKDKLAEYKKGVMQQLFNGKWHEQDGQLTFMPPTLRFKADDGSEFPDWEERTIEDVCNVGTGNKDTQNRIDDGLYPFYVRSNTVERINSFSYDGEAILTSGDGVGVGKNYHYVNGKFDYHQRVYCLNEFKAGNNGKYIYYYFSEHFYRRVIRLSAKNSVDSVRRDMITKMHIPAPTEAEQSKIANFLSAIDQKIDLANSELNKAKEWKKGLLQQMFV